MSIRTVLGDIDMESAGHIQYHEHILLQKGKSYKLHSMLWMDDENLSAEELFDYKNTGGGLIVDAQPVFAGRMADGLIRLSNQTSIHIVATTGFHKREFYEDCAPMMEEGDEKLTRLYVDELTIGMIGESGVRLKGCCGILKGALEADSIEKSIWYQRRFQALANAAQQVGVPIMFHVDQGADLHRLLRFLSNHKIDFDRVTLCHLDRTHQDPALHIELLKAGVRLNYDSICRLKYLNHEQEINLISAMCKEGFASRITLSLDTTRERLAAYGGYIGLNYILTTFRTMLRQRGLTEEEIEKMTKTNGQNALNIKNIQ